MCISMEQPIPIQPERHLSAEDYPLWLEAALGLMRYVFSESEHGKTCFWRFCMMRERHVGEGIMEHGLSVTMQAERSIFHFCRSGSKNTEGEFAMFAVLTSWLDRDGPLGQMTLVELQTRYGLRDEKKYNSRGRQTERASMHARRSRLEQFLKAQGFLGYKAPGGKEIGRASCRERVSSPV